MIVKDLNRYSGKDKYIASGYDGIHEGVGYGAECLEGEKILEMGPALDMTVCNTFFKKCVITYTSGHSKTQIDYIMVKNNDRKRVRNVKFISGEYISYLYVIP